MAGEEPVTQDQVRLLLRANVDLPEDAPFAAQSGADGVGSCAPSFSSLAAPPCLTRRAVSCVSAVVESFSDHAVIIRTYDMAGTSSRSAGFPAERIRCWAGGPSQCIDEPSCSALSSARCCVRPA